MPERGAVREIGARVFLTHGGRFIAERVTAMGNTLRVVFVEQQGDAVAYVITAYRVGGRNR